MRYNLIAGTCGYGPDVFHEVDQDMAERVLLDMLFKYFDDYQDFDIDIDNWHEEVWRPIQNGEPVGIYIRFNYKYHLDHYIELGVQTWK